jgi:hypothetical protein
VRHTRRPRLAIQDELARPEHAERILSAYPRTRVELVAEPGPAGAPGTGPRVR